MKKDYSRVSPKEAPWIKEEEKRLLKRYMEEASEETDLEDFVRKNASPRYLKELDAYIAI